MLGRAKVLSRSRLAVMVLLSRGLPILMARNPEIRDMLTMPLYLAASFMPFFGLPAQCPLMAQSGHRPVHCTCPLLG